LKVQGPNSDQVSTRDQKHIFPFNLKTKQNLMFRIKFKVNLTIFLEIFNKNVNFIKNITI